MDNAEEWPGAACIPCQFGCSGNQPPECMRPIRCPDCGRLWKSEYDEELVAEAGDAPTTEREG